MAYSGRQLTPSGFYTFFSLGAGAATASFVHDHQVLPLIAGLLIWLGSMAFISARAKKTNGVFLDQAVQLYYGFGIGSYFVGLVFASFFYVLVP